MNTGRYDIGKARITERQEAIKQAFHVDLFQMFSGIEKQMTAREVAERASEKLIQFSPTFARMTTELFNPLLERVFGIALRAFALGRPEEIPAGAKQVLDAQRGVVDVSPPVIQYSSRIALAMRNLPTAGLWRTVELVQQMITIGQGDVADNINWDESVRDAAYNDGMLASHIYPKSEVEKKRAVRQAQAAQIQNMQQMQMGADALGKVGRIPTDSAIATMMAGQPSQ
jgi:hypothetical protein